MQYVRKDKVYKAVNKVLSLCEFKLFGLDADLFNAIRDIPSENVREDVQGGWMYTEYLELTKDDPIMHEWNCIICGRLSEEEKQEWNFCPICGARMTREGEQYEGSI